MADEINLKESDLPELETILESYLSESPKSRMHKLDLEFSCIFEEQSDTIEDICYFAARDISESGNIVRFAEFLRRESENMYASSVYDLIEPYMGENVISDDVKKPKEKETDLKSNPPTITIDGLIYKLENSLRSVIPSEPKPKKESEIHTAIKNLLAGTEFEEKYTHEKERNGFGVTSSIPDFVFKDINLALEVKFCNSKSDILKITNQMSEDVTKYKKNYTDIIFHVYDLSNIQDENLFKKDFTDIENVYVVITKH